MGLIINLPNDVKHYASINRNVISFNKIVEQLKEYDGDEEPDPNDEDIAYKFTNILIGYEITGRFNVWTNESDYNLRDEDTIKNTINVSITVPTLPTNLYIPLYEELKKTLHSYEDDI